MSKQVIIRKVQSDSNIPSQERTSSFFDNGLSSLSGGFLRVGDSVGKPSDILPDFFMTDGIITGLKFNNTIDSAYQIIELYLNDTKVFEWNIDHARYGWKNDISIPFLDGDSLSVKYLGSNIIQLPANPKVDVLYKYNQEPQGEATYQSKKS